MNKNDLVSVVSHETGTSKKYADDMVSAVLESICAGLIQDGVVSFSNKFKIEAYTRAERQGKNPLTGEIMTIPAKRTLRIKPFKEFAEELNK